MVVEKSDRIRDLILPVKTENIKELYHDVDKLTDRYNDLSTRVNDKLNHAKEQENLFDDIQRQLDDMEQKADDFLNKYITSQDLSIAMEDIDQLHSLLNQIPTSAMENIIERGLRENLLKKADIIKNKIKNLLLPLEKDMKKEQELMQNVHEILSTITSIGDDVIGVDSINEPSQQLMSIGELTENLRKLKGKVEKLEGKLHNSEGMVKRALISDDLYDRVVQLQNALDDKKEKLTDRAKLYSTTAEINLINENVQHYINEMEQIPLQTVEEQNNALSELEGKKHQLEILLENIPMNDEGNKLREDGNRLLAQLNDILKRLADAVGEKLAALASFNAIRDEIEIQLSSLQSMPIFISDEITLSELDHQLCDINSGVQKLLKLKEKISHVGVSECDREQCDEKKDLLSRIDEVLEHAEKDHEYFDKKRAQLFAHERISVDCKTLHSELVEWIKNGQELLDDSESLPESYDSVSKKFDTLSEKIFDLRKEPNIEQSLVFVQLCELIDKGKDLQLELSKRALMWENFVKERDSAVEELNDIRRQICEIEGRGVRRFDKMLDDLEALKALYLRWSFLADLPSRLLSLCSQLHPLACARREGEAFVEEASELEKKIENLLDSMSAEFRVREEIMHSLLVISDELGVIRNAFDNQNISACLQKKLEQKLEGIRAHLKTLDEDITKYNANRIFLNEEEDITTKRNFEQLEEIEERLKRLQLTDTEEYDIDAAAEVLAAIYPNDYPRDVLREQGIPFDDDLYDLSPSSATSDDDDVSKFETPDDEVMLEESDVENAVEVSASSDVVALSPIPDDPSPGRVHYVRQRSRWRRILRTALPLQAMLVLLLGAACLVPHCDDESCCQLLNNFARSFDPSLEFVNGPPPF
ncbi:myosin-like protein, putative [Brugia malayi]|uniref:Myosin-like protein, putative n=1 Tax=Brugia malayi TaxID=6279 RepID=A0A4E9FEG4_BRUMA|nr:myosin-like protein, putative [Brugia malayi]VIO95325.1 myosin-like protein, putative [Brugia malayi]